MSETSMEKTVGSLKISEDVIASIASVATTEIAGVAALTAKPINFKKILTAKSTSKAVDVTLNDDIATIDVFFNIKYGMKIPDVSLNVQKNVKASVQNMTGVTVSKVNVHITGVNFETASKEQTEQNEI